MNAGPTSTRIYETLRLQLRQRGYRPGTRLDPLRLADELGSSQTPVRDALHILAGEDLVVALPNGGFTTASFDEQGLFDLYCWNSDVLTAALRCQTPQNASPSPEEITNRNEIDLADRVAILFQWVANSSTNREHGWAITRINARLYGARMAEGTMIKEGEQELHAMNLCFGQNMYSDMRKLVARYTNRRKRLAGQILINIQRNALI